jgi:gluconate 2-dehydrogenase alpha chain
VSGDPRVLGNTAIAKFDVLVIGSGAGGGSVAHILCKQGLKVLVLEAGANHFDGLDDPTQQPASRFSNDEIKHGPRNFVTPHTNVEPRTFRASESDGDRTIVGDVQNLPKTVGGGTTHADLKMPRFRPTDLQLGTLLGAVSGASFADWPVQYDALELFYTYVEKTIGIQGIAGADPFEGPRSQPLPMPPGVPMYVAQKFGAAITKLGYHPFPYPTAVNSQPYDGRPACVDCGFCSGFGCPSNAKGSSAVTMLRKALLTGNCLLLSETRAAKLLMNGAKDTVVGVDAIGPDGTHTTYTADRYVLAASPIEDARLLFLSDPAGVGNSSGMVGRCLMFHFQTNCVGIFEERLHGHRGRTVTHGFSDFRGVPGDSTKPLAGIVEISGSEGPYSEAQYYASILRLLGGSWDGARFKSLMRQSPGRDRVIALALQAEDAPQLTNRVDLDPAVKDLDGLPVARVTYQNHAFELSARDFYAPKLLDALGAAGAKWAILAPADKISGSAHIMGTLRMGNDPRASVCDATGRFHDVGNLYAADGCLFPTSSGFNPTHTIMALATRVAGGMVFAGSPEKALG